jgi:short-subunit dehydrogenase
VTGAVRLAHHVAQDLVANGGGHLLFTSSVVATAPGPYQSTYAASKAFLYSLSLALHQELMDDGVVVTALMPGPTDTEFFKRARMEDTKFGESDRDDPADVAADGYQALMAGKDHVIAGSFKNKAQVAGAKAMPDKIAAKVSGELARPRSGD